MEKSASESVHCVLLVLDRREEKGDLRRHEKFQGGALCHQKSGRIFEVGSCSNVSGASNDGDSRADFAMFEAIQYANRRLREQVFSGGGRYESPVKFVFSSGRCDSRSDYNGQEGYASPRSYKLINTVEKIIGGISG